MREFFKGWRRKAGVVTLVMAMALTGMWVRSLSRDDWFDFSIGDSNYRISSSREYGLSWIWWSKTLDASPSSAILDRHYGPIVLLFFLVSTCLILWKPRKREPSGQISNINSN